MVAVKQITHLVITIVSIVLLLLTIGFVTSRVYADESDYNTHTIIVHNSFHTITDQQSKDAYRKRITTDFTARYPQNYNPNVDGPWISSNDFVSAELTTINGNQIQLENTFDNQFYTPKWSYDIGDEETLKLVIKTDKRFDSVEPIVNSRVSSYAVQIHRVDGLDSSKDHDRNNGNTMAFENDSDRTIEIWLKSYPKVGDLDTFLSTINTLKESEDEKIVFTKDWKPTPLDHPVRARLSWKLTKDQIEKDANAIWAATKGLGCDQGAVYGLLLKCRFYLDKVAAAFEYSTKRDFFAHLKSELSIDESQLEQLRQISSFYNVDYNDTTERCSLIATMQDDDDWEKKWRDTVPGLKEVLRNYEGIEAEELDVPDYYVSSIYIDFDSVDITNFERRFRVTYDNNIGSKKAEEDIIGALPYTLKQPPERYGYEFKCWSTEKDGNGKTYDLHDTLNEDDFDSKRTLTLYAQWIKKATVTFYPSGGTLEDKTGEVVWIVDINDTITLPKPTKKGYVFDCWDEPSYKAGSEYKVASDHEFIAKWKKEYTLTWPDGSTYSTTDKDEAQKLLNKEKLLGRYKTDEEGKILLKKYEKYGSIRIHEVKVPAGHRAEQMDTEVRLAEETATIVNPVVEDESYEPSDSQGAKKNDTEGSKTGDNTALLLFLISFIVSGIAVLALIFRRKRKPLHFLLILIMAATLCSGSAYLCQHESIAAENDSNTFTIYKVDDSGHPLEDVEFEIYGKPIVDDHDDDFTDIKVRKQWDDAGYEDKRPKRILINLLADGEVFRSHAFSAEENWEYTFKGLPKTKDGKTIQYTVTENTIETEGDYGYAATVDKYTITNKFTRLKVTVRKATNPIYGLIKNTPEVSFEGEGISKSREISGSYSDRPVLNWWMDFPLESLYTVYVDPGEYTVSETQPEPDLDKIREVWTTYDFRDNWTRAKAYDDLDYLSYKNPNGDDLWPLERGVLQYYPFGSWDFELTYDPDEGLGIHGMETIGLNELIEYENLYRIGYQPPPYDPDNPEPHTAGYRWYLTLDRNKYKYNDIFVNQNSYSPNVSSTLSTSVIEQGKHPKDGYEELGPDWSPNPMWRIDWQQDPDDKNHLYINIYNDVIKPPRWK